MCENFHGFFFRSSADTLINIIKLNNYDAISNFYDPLSQLVFGGAQLAAKKDQLIYLKPYDNILILGGGTGQILQEISHLNLTGLHVDYVEASSKMIKLAKKRETANVGVNFIHLSAQNFMVNIKYNVIMTSFFFDNFTEISAIDIFSKANNLLQFGGVFLFSDFYINPEKKFGWKNLMLKSMHFFFRIVANLEARKLFETSALFKEANYSIEEERWYYKNFIRAVVYKKN